MPVKRLAPGIYIANGELQVDCVELCLASGLVPTRENQDRVERLVLEAYETVVGEPPKEHVVHEGPPPWKGFG